MFACECVLKAPELPAELPSTSQVSPWRLRGRLPPVTCNIRVDEVKATARDSAWMLGPAFSIMFDAKEGPMVEKSIRNYLLTCLEASVAAIIASKPSGSAARHSSIWAIASATSGGKSSPGGAPNVLPLGGAPLGGAWPPPLDAVGLRGAFGEISSTNGICVRRYLLATRVCFVC